MTDLMYVKETEIEELSRLIEEDIWDAIDELDRITAEFFKEMEAIKWDMNLNSIDG